MEKIDGLQNIAVKMSAVIKPGHEQEWLNSPLPALGGRTPFETLSHGYPGIQKVLKALR
jgi:hypothetical protein